MEGSSKRSRPEPSPVMVKSPDLASKMADISQFVEKIEEERNTFQTNLIEAEKENEALKEKVAELEQKNAEIGYKCEDFERIESDAAYWKSLAGVNKTKAEDIEMECKIVTGRHKMEMKTMKQNSKKDLAQIKSLESAYHAMKEELSSFKDVAENSKNIVSRMKGEVKSHMENITSRDSRIADMEANISRILHEKNNMCIEIKSLNETVVQMKISIGGLTSIKAKLEMEKSRLLEQNQASVSSNAKSTELVVGKLASEMEEIRKDKEKLQHTNAGLENDLNQIRQIQSQIEEQFYDEMLMENVGINVLLNNGKMVSLPYVLDTWKACPCFDGTPNSNLKCASTSSVTSIVHNPAIYDFTAKIARLLTLDTKFPSYLRYSMQPITTQGRCIWVNYKMHDQLTVMAKLIFMFNNPDSRFIANISDGHAVTAYTNPNRNTGRIDITLALTIISCDGVASKHHIDLVDTPFSFDGTNLSTFVPGIFNIVGEI